MCIRDSLYDIKPVTYDDAGYYHIVADNGCGDPVESETDYRVDVTARPSGTGTTDTNAAGEVTGWLDVFEVNNNGYVYAKGFTCSKNYNESIVVKVVAVDANGHMDILAGYKTHLTSQVQDRCLNSGAGKHNFEWTSPKPAHDYRGKTIMVKGIHPSGQSSLDRVLPPKNLEIK